MNKPTAGTLIDALRSKADGVLPTTTGEQQKVVNGPVWSAMMEEQQPNPTTGEQLQTKCCHGNTVNECDGTCIDDTRCTPPSVQANPTTTGEWTATSVWKLLGEPVVSSQRLQDVANAHEAALAAERQNRDDALRREYENAQQLAAEREKREKAEQRERDADEDALRQVNALRARLAAEQSRYIKLDAIMQAEIDKLRDQLSAERDERNATVLAEHQLRIKVEQQLAAERKNHYKIHAELASIKMHRDATLEQLAAENEKRELAERLFQQRDKEMSENLALGVELEKERNQLRQQLAASEKMAEALEGALHHPDSPSHSCIFKTQLATAVEALKEIQRSIKAGYMLDADRQCTVALVKIREGK